MWRDLETTRSPLGEGSMFQPALRVAFSLLFVTSCAGPGVDESTFPSAPEVAALLAEGALEVPPIGAYGRQVSGASPSAQIMAG